MILTREQIRQVDRRAVEQLGMSGLVLMENAGRGTADYLREAGARATTVVCCGAGNNGGDGFVIARHLDYYQVPVKVLLFASPEKLRGDALENYRLLSFTDVEVSIFDEAFDPARVGRHLYEAQWIVDALLGTGAAGDPREPFDRLIDLMNRVPAERLAVDLPSGLDCDTGRAGRPTFRADHTCTFVAPKPGLLAAESAPYVGRLITLPIGVPRKLLREIVGPESSDS